MQIDPTLEDIRAKLQAGRFPNEQSISQGIVLRVLSGLDWDIYDTTTVWPEYSTGDGRVDFALCHPRSKPIVLLEVKKPGGAEAGVRQALQYAFHTGVPFVVLTDGSTWSFYLPAEQGSYEERRVFKLNLLERSPGESAEVLTKYLGQENVASGQALETARMEYQSNNRRSVARKSIPSAWRGLIDRGDELLVDLIIDAVESKVGVRPDEEDVVAFLASLTQSYPTPSPIAGNKGESHVVSEPPSSKPGSAKLVGSPPVAGVRTLVILGTEYTYGTAKEAMVKVLRVLSDGDPDFLPRCYQNPGFRGRKRRYLAQQAAELYPDREDLRDYCEVVRDEWLVSTNRNNRLKLSIMKKAVEVAGLTWAADVVVNI